ncbi:hypothetical protein, partial [Pseudokineococcus marinus]
GPDPVPARPAGAGGRPAPPDPLDPIRAVPPAQEVPMRRVVVPAVLVAALTGLLLAPPAVATAPAPAPAQTSDQAPDQAPDQTPDQAPEQAAAAADGRTTWTVQPSSGGAADGRVSLRQSLAPGATGQDEVLVTNFGPAAARFRVHVGDGVVGAGEAFDVAPAGSTPGGSGAWVSLGEVPGGADDGEGGVVVALAPEQQVAVPLTTTVPADVVPGDHPAGVVAEVLPEGDEPLEVAARVGVRLHLRVTGDVRAAVVAEDVEARWRPSWNPFSSGSVLVTYGVRNAGQVRVAATSDVRVSGPVDALGATASDSWRELLPGQVVPASTDLSVWGLLRSGGRVVVEGAPVGADVLDAEPVGDSVPLVVWTVPWPQLVLLLLAGLVLVVVVRRRRAAERRVQERIDAAVAAATASSDAAR